MPSIWLVPLILVILVFLLSAASTLVGPKYNWDVDHMMYFGARLLHGELVWTREFDDKLPIVQFLFAIPAAFGSVRIWQLFSIFSVIAAAVAITWGLRLILIRDWKLERAAASYFAAAAAVTYLYLAAVWPDSLSHINATAASLVTIATLITLAAARPAIRSMRDLAGRLVIAAMLASIAVSMRPYFIAPVLLLALWASVRVLPVHPSASSGEGSRKDARGYLLASRVFVLWIFALGISGLLINAAPYLITGQLSAFFDGLFILSQELVVQSVRETISDQMAWLRRAGPLTHFVIACWVLFAVGFLSWAVKIPTDHQAVLRFQKVDVFFAVILSPLALEVMILGKHYWSHYQVFFIPYAALMVAFMLAFLRHHGYFQQAHLKGAQALTGFLILAFCVAVQDDLRRFWASWSHAPSVSDPNEIHLNSFVQYLDSRGLADADFLNPHHMYFHWRLDQARHGFPHAANTNMIFYGWWSDLNLRPGGLAIPKSDAEYCEMLQRHGPRFVVEFEDQPVVACMGDQSRSRYRVDAILESHRESRLLVYERVDGG